MSEYRDGEGVVAFLDWDACDSCCHSHDDGSCDASYTLEDDGDFVVCRSYLAKGEDDD